MSCTFVEEVIEEQGFQIFFFVECGGNIFQEDTLKIQ
jgi:hypothetical protein